jgi:proteasome lid subunit RPN8/RPN11
MARKFSVGVTRDAGASVRRAPGRSTKRVDVVGLRDVSEAAIYPHVFNNADREVGGVLVGRTPADGGLPMITGAIPAISADEQRATLTFTQDSWAHVHQTLETEFPEDEQIVGWYHSHPGFGIFLSGHDLFIHENFFGGASQIAVVVDPCACAEGVFVWCDGELVVLFERDTPKRWAERPDPRALLPTREASAGTTPALDPAPRYPVLALAIAGVLGVLVGFGGWELAEGGGGPSQTPTPTLAGAHKRKPKRATPPATVNHIERLVGPGTK